MYDDVNLITMQYASKEIGDIKHIDKKISTKIPLILYIKIVTFSI